MALNMPQALSDQYAKLFITQAFGALCGVRQIKIQGWGIHNKSLIKIKCDKAENRGSHSRNAIKRGFGKKGHG